MSDNYRQFSDTLNALKYGHLNDELGREMAALTKRCEDTGKTGELTLKLKIKPGKAGQVEIFDEIKVKAPAEERSSTLMFVTVEGNLVRNDPRQGELEGLRTIDTPAPKALRNVG